MEAINYLSTRSRLIDSDWEYGNILVLCCTGKCMRERSMFYSDKVTGFHLVSRVRLMIKPAQRSIVAKQQTNVYRTPKPLQKQEMQRERVRARQRGGQQTEDQVRLTIANT